MEETDRNSGDALIEQLELVTTKLETHIENFRFEGSGVAGSIKEGGFTYNPSAPQ